jgi:hypothetical protein
MKTKNEHNYSLISSYVRCVVMQEFANRDAANTERKLKLAGFSVVFFCGVALGVMLI